MDNPESNLFQDDDQFSFSQKLIGNLTLLNYEREYCKARGLRPINDAYFIT